MQQLPEAFAALAIYRQFILWMLVERDGKIVKLPIDYNTTSVADAHNPAIWTDATTAINTAQLFGEGYGVGFVFTKNDPFYFVDIDHCLQPDGNWSPTALAVLNTLPGAAVEISQSGEGLHIIGKGVTPDHGCKNIPLGLELYTEGRFVALTGNNVIGSADVDNSIMLPGLVNTYFPPKVTVNPETWTTGPAVEWNGPKDDDKLIKKALASKSAASAFGARATFADLWDRNVDILSGIFTPDESDSGEFDESSADAALAQHLAFWTGNDCERISRLMNQSGLVRGKWVSHKSYLKGTIIKAVSMQENVYTGGKKPEPPRVSIDAAADPLGNIKEPEILAGYQFLGVTQQIEHFKGCVYVQEMHKVFTPSGSFLKPDQFNATYGGYVFQLDGDVSGKTTRKAWEAFTESQAIRYPKSESTTFKPGMQPGTLIKHDGRMLVNTYVPINTPRAQGDATPFLNHLSIVIPDEHDRAILLAYMAACIQHKGVKFQWAPLIQGVPGNGKTLFTRCVAFAIGERYTHMPPAEQIAEKFNSWLFNTLFIGVEDIYVPDHKSEIIEILKPMITNTRYAKRAMQTDQVMHDICCNFIFNSNHKDAVRKTKNDRRFAIFYSAQQTVEDNERDGLDGNYFPALYEWLRSGGYAIVSEFLHTYQIPVELNPAGACHRAPKTTSTDEAINASMGGIEQEILEAIDEGRPGFAGGWVSSMALDKLLENIRATRIIPPNKRREMLQSLGYEWHPDLNNGRVNNITMVDGGKPRLFIKAGHLALNLTGPAEIAKAYSDAQTAPVGTSAAAMAFNKH